MITTIIISVVAASVVSVTLSYFTVKFTMKHFNIDELHNVMLDSAKILSHLKKQYKKNSEKMNNTKTITNAKLKKQFGKDAVMEVHTNPEFKDGKG